MATIRVRGGRWEAQIRRYGWPTQTKHFNKKRDADAWAADVESRLARGIVQDRRRVETTLFRDLLIRYRDEVTPSKKGAEAERARLAAFLRTDLARLSLDRLQPEMFSQWRDRRMSSVSGSTVNRELNLLSVVINTARKDWGFSLDNPISLIRRPAENRARRRRLSIDEEQRLLTELAPATRGPDGLFRKGGTRNAWARALVVLALETAMRRSELLALRWDDVFSEDAYVRLHDSKNGEPRDVPLSCHAVETLQTILRLERDPRVFPMTAEAFKQVFERAVSRAGIVGLRFHDLRHEATSRLAMRLSNVLELGAVTGHKTLRMLARYYHPRASDLARKLG